MGKNRIALMRYRVVAPADVANPVIDQSNMDGNPIAVMPNAPPGWVVMELKIRPIDEWAEDVNWSLIVTRMEPKQTLEVKGSQGGYMKDMRARMHTFLKGGGDSKVAAQRLGEYRRAEGKLTVPSKTWGEPRKPGKASEHLAPKPAGVRGKDKHKRGARRDRYLVLVAPSGETLHMLPRSKHAQALAKAGYPAPRDWRYEWRITEGPKDNRPVTLRLAGMSCYGAAALPFELFLKGQNPGFPLNAQKSPPASR